MTTVPRRGGEVAGRWRVEKRVTGWAAVSPEGHVIRQPGQAAAFAYAVGRVHQAQILRHAHEQIVTNVPRPSVRLDARSEEILAHRAMDAIGGY